MTEEMDTRVELVDENGNAVQFEHIVTIEYEDNEYALLVPVDEVEEEEQGVVILKILPGRDGEEDTYEGVEDEELLDAVFAEFQRMLQEEEDFSD